MTNHTADRFKPFGTTIFAEMSKLAAEHGAVNLSQGFPDFDGPEFVKHAAIDAIKQGHNQYARSQGQPPLVEQLAERFDARTGIKIDPFSQVTVTSGCTEAIAATLLGIINSADEVILFEPYYDSYRACIAMAQGIPKFVGMKPVDGRFTFDINELKAAFTDKTKAILVNTPHNPTGTMLTRDELTQIADLCKAHNSIAVSDEVYEDLTFERQHISIASIPGMLNRTITLSSLGKSFSLTGWKIGWAIASPELSTAVRSAHQFLTYASATPFQHAAAAALREGDDYIAQLREQYRASRDMLAAELDALGFGVTNPEGTYFILAEHSAISDKLGVDNDIDLALKLTSEFGVTTIPPSVFCETKNLCSNYLRFAFCKKEATLTEAIHRLQKLNG
jgi:aspartate/methionine/tyrosine aminotransferase